MGTDIHPAVEIRRNGVWRYHRPKEPCLWYFQVYDEEMAKRINEHRAERGDPLVKVGDRANPWDRCKTRLPDCFRDRNYTKFAVLGDVRNGFGFAGVPTFEPIVEPISSDRGVPYDISREARAKLSDEHDPGWVTLAELEAYDWTRPLAVHGVVTERVFLEHYVQRKDPQSWSGGISGKDIEVLTPDAYIDLFESSDGWKVDKLRSYDPAKRYHIRLTWEVPLASHVPDILEMIAYLRPLVPKGGTPDDVRVVFDFDS